MATASKATTKPSTRPRSAQHRRAPHVVAASVGNGAIWSWESALLAIAAVFAARLLLVLLFLPFSALDKVLNWNAALAQAGQGAPKPLGPPLILCGIGVEVFMSLGVLTGVADRLAALILAAYCVATAILWKQFWRSRGFRLRGASEGRDVFWDFLKNLAVAGGFLMITVGVGSDGVARFAADPLASSHPYARSSPGVS